MATEKRLSFAGITLPLQNPQHAEWLRYVHPQHNFVDFDGWNFDQPNTAALPTPSLPKPPDFQVGVLHWPTAHATRPAWFHAVVTLDILREIRTAVADPMTPQDLVFDDGRTGKIVTASMYCLPPRPLNQPGDPDPKFQDGWLLTLTDQRFYWYFRRGTIPTQPASWNSLYAQLGAILGISITVDTVDPDYGVPSSKWINYYSPTPVLLDAVAKQVGQRIVVKLDGTVHAKNWETAKTTSDSYVDDADAVVSGGLFASADIAKYVPASVNVLFANSACTTPTPAPHVVNKPLVGLSVSGYGTSTGITGFSQTLFADILYDGHNEVTVDAYAQAMAIDWYGWRSADVDVVWPGIEPWTPTGWEDCVEWTLQKRGEQPFSSTRVRRGPWSSMTSGNWYAGTTPLPPNADASGFDCAPGCGWIAGLATGSCLSAFLLSSCGSCSGLDSSQSFNLLYTPAESKWVSKTWSSGAGWTDTNFNFDTGAQPLKVWLDQTSAPVPAASIGSTGLVLDCCGSNFAVFAGGPNLASGFCTGTNPDPCSANTFRVKVVCECCPIDGWDGAGWYCIVDTGEDCDIDPVTIVYLNDGDKCIEGITICAGPFPTQEEAEDFCGGGGPPPPIEAPCNGNTALFGSAIWSNKTGDCTCMATDGRGENPDVLPDFLNFSSQEDPPACPGSLTFHLACVDGRYSLTTGTSDVFMILLSFTPGPPNTILVYHVSGSGFAATCGSTGTADVTITGVTL